MMFEVETKIIKYYNFVIIPRYIIINIHFIRILSPGSI